MDAMVSWPPAWSLVLRGYFSPAMLFLLLNVVIGTITLTSRFHRRHHHHHGDDKHHHGHDEHHHLQQRYHDQYAPPPAPLARTSSVMERLRSLGLYRFRSGDFPPEYNLSAASTIGDDESNKQQQAQYTRSRSEPAARPPVDKKDKEEEKSAKVKVVKKSSSDVKRLERAPAPAQARLVQRSPRAPSRAVVARDQEVAEAAMEKCVDARADDFINKFRQQLQLQRLNSLLNYKEMLNSGT